MTQVLIVGHSGALNKGCEALARSTIDIVKRYLKPEHIDLISEYPESDQANFANEYPEVTIHASHTHVLEKYSSAWWQHKWNINVQQKLHPGLPMYYTRQHQALYQKADVIISTGGDTFSDDYGAPLEVFGELYQARQVGAFTMIWAASIGPFKNSKMARHWANALQQIHLIGVRENKTLDYLREYGVSDNVIRVADPAFLLPRHPVAIKKPQSTRIVGLGMSGLVSRYGATQQQYIEASTQFAQQLLEDSNTEVWLVAHVIVEGHNDADICRTVAQRLNNPARVKLIEPSYNACQVKYAIAQCDYFIGARTHSTIASLSSGIPTLSIGYSVKAVGINEDLFGHTDYVLPIQEVSVESLMQKFQLLVEQRDEIIKHLETRLPAIRAMSELSGIKLAEAYQAWKAK